MRRRLDGRGASAGKWRRSSVERRRRMKMEVDLEARAGLFLGAGAFQTQNWPKPLNQCTQKDIPRSLIERFGLNLIVESVGFITIPPLMHMFWRKGSWWRRFCERSLSPIPRMRAKR